MSTPSAEALVVLEPAAGAAGREAVARVTAVRQAAGDRLLVIDASAADAVRALPGVARVVTDPADVASLAAGGMALGAGERLFADAWAERRARPREGPRRGDGLPWDAPGFEAP